MMAYAGVRGKDRGTFPTQVSEQEIVLGLIRERSIHGHQDERGVEESESVGEIPLASFQLGPDMEISLGLEPADLGVEQVAGLLQGSQDLAVGQVAGMLQGCNSLRDLPSQESQKMMCLSFIGSKGRESQKTTG